MVVFIVLKRHWFIQWKIVKIFPKLSMANTWMCKTAFNVDDMKKNYKVKVWEVSRRV